MIPDGFEWDDAKAASNFGKHGVTFNEAATVFDDLLAASYPDPAHSDDEDRYLTIGHTTQGRVVVVSHTDRDGLTRIISARGADRRERQGYQSGTFP